MTDEATTATTPRQTHSRTRPSPLSEETSTSSGAEFSLRLPRFSRAIVMDDVRRLSHVSNLRSALIIAWQWIVIFTAGYAAVHFGHWLGFVLAGIVISGRQQALGVLMHDGAHYLLFTNRALNDIASDLFLAFPMGLSTTLYRSTHFQHHRFTNTSDDPDTVLQQADSDWHWPKSRREGIWLILRSLFGLNLHRTIKAFQTWSPSTNLFRPLSDAYPLRARLVFVLSTPLVFWAVLTTGLWYWAIWLWLIPALTLTNLTSRVRSTAEHILAPSTHELNATRTVLPTWLERLTVAPLGINYHIEHHLFPSVPGPNLAELHGRLMQEEEFRTRAHITRGYAHPGHGVLGELTHPQTS